MNPEREKLGAALRKLREDRRMTLAEVATRTGLSTATLSKLENALVSLTYEKLVRLSEGLGLDFNAILYGELLQTSQVAPSIMLTARRSVTRAGEGLRIETENYEYNYLSVDISKKRMLPILIKVRARSTKKVMTTSSHSGEEFFYVLSGVVEIRSDHYEPVILRKGDSIYFDATMKHVMLSASDEDAYILDVNAPFDHRSAVPAEDDRGDIQVRA